MIDHDLKREMCEALDRHSEIEERHSIRGEALEEGQKQGFVRLSDHCVDLIERHYQDLLENSDEEGMDPKTIETEKTLLVGTIEGQTQRVLDYDEEDALEDAREDVEMFQNLAFLWETDRDIRRLEGKEVRENETFGEFAEQRRGSESG